MANSKKPGGLPPNLSTLPTLGPGDVIGEGDSSIQHDVVPDPDGLFWRIVDEVRWQTMKHLTSDVPRLVCVQAAVDGDGSVPVYRHPSDSPVPVMHLSPAVVEVCKRAEAMTGHLFNHALIQLYRSGDDYISEHADKTVDIRPGSTIVNVSLGARRTMRLRQKPRGGSDDSGAGAGTDGRLTQRIHLPHGSAFCLGLETNARWLHGIMPDRRRAEERDPSELAFGGVRVSITLRWISTWISPERVVLTPDTPTSTTAGTTIFGLGATAKHRRHARPTVDGDEEASEAMVKAFGAENRTCFTQSDWDRVYGTGFDVVGLGKGQQDVFSAEPRMIFHPPRYCQSGADPVDEVADDELEAAATALSAMVVPRPVIPIVPPDRFRPAGTVVMRDVDLCRTEILGRKEILSFASGITGAVTDPDWLGAAAFEAEVVGRDGRRDDAEE